MQRRSPINPFPMTPWFLHVCSTKSLENTVGKGEIARGEQCFPFPTVFSTCLVNCIQFSLNLKLSSANSLEESKMCGLVKDYIYFV